MSPNKTSKFLALRANVHFANFKYFFYKTFRATRHFCEWQPKNHLSQLASATKNSQTLKHFWLKFMTIPSSDCMKRHLEALKLQKFSWGRPPDPHLQDIQASMLLPTSTVFCNFAPLQTHLGSVLYGNDRTPLLQVFQIQMKTRTHYISAKTFYCNFNPR